MEPLTVVSVALGIGGFAFGLAADRFATRWPEHDEEHPPGRRVDWRTGVVAVTSALAFGLLPIRFAGDPLGLAIFGAWFVTLVVGLATDLDQRLLPDVLTLPVIPVALVYALTGQNPFVGGAVVAGGPRRDRRSRPLLYLPSIPFGAGAFGLGDVKLLVGVGLLTGASRLLGSRRLRARLSGGRARRPACDQADRRKTYVPFGPFFIIGALWAVLVRP